MLVVASQVVLNHVVLNEVHYDPAGADGGMEYVELAVVGAPAEGGDGVSLAGWRLETGNGAAPDGDWKVAWVGGAEDRAEGGLFVVGEDGVTPRPDAVAELDLQNGPDACRLVAPDGGMDVCGWGSPLPDGLYEGAPAPDVASGRSLARLPDGRDTGSNAADFADAAPTPGAFNAPARWLVVEGVAWPPADAPPAQAWEFRWSVRNRGREPWSGVVRAGCAVHPGEVLAEASREEALAPGDAAELAARASPPPGPHRPRSDPAAPDSVAELAPAWLGGGEEVFVSEILAAPLPGDVEWVELLARSALDWSAFALTDAAGARAPLRGVAAAGERVVFTPDTTVFRRQWGVAARVVEVSPWPSVNQTAAAGAVAERLAVVLGEREVAAGVVPGGGKAGIAWERIALALPGESVSSWGGSLDPSGGTPGRENSRRGDRAAPRGDGALLIAPQPYRPGVDASVLVVVRGADGGAGIAAGGGVNGAPGRGACRIGIRDSVGRAVAVLSPWAADGEWRAVWDGRAADGTAAPLGLYLVLAERDGARSLRAPLVLVR